MARFGFAAACSLRSFKCRPSSPLIGNARLYSNAAGNDVAKEKSGVLPFEKIPGPKSLPIIGNMLRYLPIIGEYDMDSMHKNSMYNYARYGKLVKEQITSDIYLVHVFDPRDIETVFRHDGRFPERRSHVALGHYRLSKPELYNSGGLLNTNGPEWWRLRSNFQKSLSSPQSVRSFVRRSDLVSNDFIQWIQQEYVGKGNQDFLHYLNRLFLETVCLIAFGDRLNSFHPDEDLPGSRTTRLIAATFNSNSGMHKLDKGFIWKYIPTPRYMQMCKSQKYLEDFFIDILTKKAQFLEKKRSANTDELSEEESLLDIYLRLKEVDTKDLIGMMVDVLMGSVDTTSYSTSFLLYHLARNPEKQELLFRECKELLPDKNGKITVELLANASYSKACIKESLRMNPVAIGVGRILQTDMELSGYHVPKGTIVVTQNMVSSRLEQYCPSPGSFLPERWLRDCKEYQPLHPFLSLPFGFGPRSCIARRLAEQSILINLIKMTRNFQFDWNSGDLDVKSLLINKPDGPVRVKFTARNP